MNAKASEESDEKVVQPVVPPEPVEPRQTANDHTSGPWQIMDDYTREGGLTIIGNVDGEYFTDSAAPVMSYQFVAKLEDEYGETHDSTAANRRLIIAAPNMLDALRRIAGGSFPGASTLAINGDWQGMYGALQAIASAAIAQAEAAR